MNIVLLGYMGSGKSTLGSKTARLLEMPFHDLDKKVEQHYKISISGLFTKYTEDVFRKLEQKILNEQLKSDNLFLSLGGGTPCFHNNMEFINQNALSIYLKLSPKSLFIRLRSSKKPRPLIKNLNDNDLLHFIEEALLQREPYYNQAKLIVKGEDLSAIALAKKIRQALNEKKS